MTFYSAGLNDMFLLPYFKLILKRLGSLSELSIWFTIEIIGDFKVLFEKNKAKIPFIYP